MYEENVGLSGELIGGIRAMKRVANVLHDQREISDLVLSALHMMLDDIENDAVNVIEKLLLN